ncbi:hypothetical protein CC1G_11792 [Coprinopsis cinerea okayama7|uniref:Uncharacterized protein n=1 Tax=Coprinopsis cinerea (strain Okayama-7 / 130 / ATCC MYA-4618 / FGSC 9003) TaxID=240176 RepID=A8NPL0_COPC7|nr:hypothetical protein CC1G_11792 [Coprinopsis cinerea okayama7\|eukprot:XP_001835358.2 hypothetical protein CC1G_11792 [Coprinopsis cinerea okayama7\
MWGLLATTLVRMLYHLVIAVIANILYKPAESRASRILKEENLLNEAIMESISRLIEFRQINAEAEHNALRRKHEWKETKIRVLNEWIKRLEDTLRKEGIPLPEYPSASGAACWAPPS